MKQKKYFILAAAAILMAACSENDVAEKQSPQVTGEGDPVNFSAYMNRSTTRAGQMGLLNTSNLQTGSESDKEKTGGFGVFGYYTNDELYSQNSKPEFFYNQKVYYDSEWKYDPVKYWPNEFGSTAESFGEDKLTFFAYAPYVYVDVQTGIAQRTEVSPATDPVTYEDELETGIISLTRNTAVGDPYVKYYASFDPEKCVDLCFGVAKDNFNNSVDGAKNNVAKGMPYIDVKKPTLGDRINLDFKHALAQLNVQIDADVDQMSHGTTPLTSKTKIYVREVTFEGIADKGMLNLNSEATTIPYTPKWVDLTGINEIKSGKVTIYDGRRDGREGQPDAKAANEKPQTLNPTIISNDNNTTEGVLGQTKKNLFAGDNIISPVLVIPTGQELGITIVYDVETEDANLATFLSDGKTHGSSVENKIYKAITINGSSLKLDAGKSYTVNLHLGMTSVKFEASVTEWLDVTPASDYDLPANAPSTTIALGSSSTASIASVPASETTGVLRVTGLGPNEVITTVTPSDASITVTPTSGTATDAGTFDVTYTIAVNNTVHEIADRTITVDAATSTDAVLTITKQEAAPLGLSIKTPAKAGDDVITLDATANMSVATDWTGAAITVKKYSGGVTSTITPTVGTSGSGDLQGTLTLAAPAVAGDVYTITVQAGDAAAETVSYTVVKNAGSISYAAANVNVAVATVNGTKEHQAITKTAGSDGTVTYEIAMTSVANPSTTSASIDSDGKVTIAGAVANDVFTVTATIADTEKWTFEPKTAYYTITAQ